MQTTLNRNSFDWRVILNLGPNQWVLEWNNDICLTATRMWDKTTVFHIRKADGAFILDSQGIPMVVSSKITAFKAWENQTQND